MNWPVTKSAASDARYTHGGGDVAHLPEPARRVGLDQRALSRLSLTGAAYLLGHVVVENIVQRGHDVSRGDGVHAIGFITRPSLEK
jgi:hypothetical protein